MKLPRLIAVAHLLFCAAHAETTPPLTPLNQALADRSVTTITCALTQPPPFSSVPIFVSDADAESSLGTYHYKLWLPGGYNADPAKQWPCLFIMSSGGDATMATMETWLKTNGFIVVMLVEARNGSWGPIIGNFLAAHDDVVKRVRVADGRKYATGVSGGARAASIFVQIRPGFCGLILQAAGVMLDEQNNYLTAGLKQLPQLRIAMTVGTFDANMAEIAPMKSAFSTQQLAVFQFNGGHTWAPSATFRKAMAWLNGEGSGKPGASPGDSFDELFKKK